MRALVVTAVVFVGLAGLGGAGCSRPCVTEQNCKKTCECENADTGAEQSCTMAFQCKKPSDDAKEKVCEADYDAMQCDELCSRFAANALCGSKRCDADADCERKMTCDILNENSEPTGQKFDCTIPFVCNATDEVCPSAFTRSDAELCVTCCLTPGVPCT